MSHRIFVPLKSAPFWKFYHGSKTVEIRDYNSPVAKSILIHEEGSPVLLRRGYNTPDELHGRLGMWVTADRLKDLPVSFLIAADLDPNMTLDYYDPNQPVLAFQVLDITVRKPESTTESKEGKRD